jgi:hypothetical protein
MTLKISIFLVNAKLISKFNAASQITCRETLGFRLQIQVL